MSRLFLFLFVLAAVGCKEVSFKEPQPKGKKPLTSVPKNLQGKYLTLTEEGVVSKDTVIITARGYRFGYFDPAERVAKNESYEEGVLSDSMVLKSFKGYYFFSLNENPEWLLRVLKQEKNGDLYYMSMEDKNLDFNSYLEKLGREVKIDSFTTAKETLYQIDPTPNALTALIDKGFFSKTKLIKVKAKK
jgi:hypothetical protein